MCFTVVMSKVQVADVEPNAKHTNNRFHGDNLGSLHACKQCTEGFNLCDQILHKINGIEGDQLLG